jgi:hypothetical protein
MQYSYTCSGIIVSVLLVCNYWQKFIETLWEPSIPRGDVHIVALFRSGPLTQSNGPWLVMQYAYRAIIISMLLLCNYLLEFNETLWEHFNTKRRCAYSRLVLVRHFICIFILCIGFVALCIPQTTTAYTMSSKQ